METFEQAPATDQPRRGWWSRNWLWFVPTVFIALLLLFGGCCAGLFWIGLRAIKKPHQMALEQVQRNAEVVKRLGQPIEQISWLPVVQGDFQAGQGSISLDFDVAGPNGEAHVRTQARMIDGTWGLTTLEVTFKDGQKLSLETAADGGLEDAPLWSPEAESESSPDAGTLDWSPEHVPTWPPEDAAETSPE